MMSTYQNQTSGHPQHIACFVALPFKDSATFLYETVLLPALRTVLELDPYYWQVVRADERYFDDIIQGNVGAWMKRVNAFIADISELNPNVMMELGYMLWARKPDQPLLVLKRSDVTHDLADLKGFITISYPRFSEPDKYAINRVAGALEGEFAKHEGIQRLNRSKQAHYLSPLFICKISPLSNEIAKNLSKEFTTLENVRDTDDDDFKRRAIACGLAEGFVKIIRNEIIVNIKS